MKLKSTIFGEKLKAAINNVSDESKDDVFTETFESEYSSLTNQLFSTESYLLVDSIEPESKIISAESADLVETVAKSEEIIVESLPGENETKTGGDSHNQFACTDAVIDFQDKCRAIMLRRYEETLTNKSQFRVHLGVDFGTSYSKVVWRSNRSETSRPICFGNNGHLLESYLVPSLISLNNENNSGKNRGIMFAGYSAENDDGYKIRNFKICLACEKDAQKDCGIDKCRLANWKSQAFSPELLKTNQIRKHETEFVTACFLARLIRRSKEKVCDDLQAQGLPPDIKIKWSATMAVPDKFIEQSGVAAIFQKTLVTAWFMAEVLAEQKNLTAFGDSFYCFTTAKKLVENLRREGKAFDCHIHSEVGAEVAAVTMSRNSPQGLYALVDIGAGTVDASVFRFSRDADNKQFTYASGVFKSGATYIEAIAHSRLPEFSMADLKKVKENLSLTPIDEAARKKIAELKSACNQMRQRSEKELTEVFRSAFQKELNLSIWVRELKLILGGGGSAIEAYRIAARKAFTLKDQPHQLPIVELAAPDDFEMKPLSERHFHRFAVAYGLAQGFNLPQVYSPDATDPIDGRIKREFVDPTDDG